MRAPDPVLVGGELRGAARDGGARSDHRAVEEERHGVARLGDDEVLPNADGESDIAVDDLLGVAVLERDASEHDVAIMKVLPVHVVSPIGHKRHQLGRKAARLVERGRLDGHF